MDNIHAECGKSIHSVTVKSLNFNRMRSVKVIRLETNSRLNRCKIAYEMDIVSDGNLMPFQKSFP